MSADSPAKALPLLAVAEVQAYSISLSPCGPALASDAVPASVTRAIAVPPRMHSGRISTASIASLISRACTFLPRYSGVRPTISPATNTASRANTRMPYRPEPTPPGTTSPSCIRNSGTMPPSGVKLSCMAITAPSDVAVVVTANREDTAVPKRTSLPSMLPMAGSTPSGGQQRVAGASAA